MWSPRQVTHLPPVWDLLLPLASTPDRRDQWLIVSHLIDQAKSGKRTRQVSSGAPTTELPVSIDGSTARRCIAIVTNERPASYVIPLNSS